MTGRELALEVPGRGRRVVLASVSPLRDARQAVNGLTIVLDDLTEQRRVEADRERIRQKFGRVLAMSVRDRLLSESVQLKLAGTRQTIPTLFAEVRGFTTLSEQLPPEEIFALLNDRLTWRLRPYWCRRAPSTGFRVTRLCRCSTRPICSLTIPCAR